MEESKLSIIVPTFNNDKYLGLFLESMATNNKNNIPIHIHLDGCTDNSEKIVDNFSEYLNIIKTKSKNRGMYSAINTAMKNVNSDYFIILNDDIFVSKNWDEGLIKACKFDRVLCPRMVEPIDGSYPPKYDCGTDPNSFDIYKFENYAKEISKDELVLYTIGMWSFGVNLFKHMSGLDESFDPFGCGGLEILYRIKVTYPNMDFLMVKNSIVYHFSTACKRENNLGSKANIDAWYDKYGKYNISIQDANNLLEGERDLFDIEKTEEFRYLCSYGDYNE